MFLVKSTTLLFSAFSLLKPSGISTLFYLNNAKPAWVHTEEFTMHWPINQSTIKSPPYLIVFCGKVHFNLALLIVYFTHKRTTVCLFISVCSVYCCCCYCHSKEMNTNCIDATVWSPLLYTTCACLHSYSLSTQSKGRSVRWKSIPQMHSPEVWNTPIWYKEISYGNLVGDSIVSYGQQRKHKQRLCLVLNGLKSTHFWQISSCWLPICKWMRQTSICRSWNLKRITFGFQNHEFRLNSVK